MNLKLPDIEESKELSMDLLRAYVGIALIGKGIYFIQNLTELFELTSTAVSYGDFIISHYIIFAHIVGGLCIAAGLLTRIAVLANLPILFGAVTFVHLQEGFFTVGQGLEVSMLMFFLLCVTLYHGSGRWSVDYYINKGDPNHETSMDNIINFSEYLILKDLQNKEKSDEDDQDKAA